MLNVSVWVLIVSAHKKQMDMFHFHLAGAHLHHKSHGVMSAYILMSGPNGKQTCMPLFLL